jgi:hypothetical protein
MTTGEPIGNPPIPPTPRTSPPSDAIPGLGAGEAAQEPKPFSLPPQPLPGQAPTAAPTPMEGRPTPMELAREREGRGGAITPEETMSSGKALLNKIQNTTNIYQDPEVKNKLSQEHYDAMMTVASKLGPDMHKIAKYTEQKDFVYPQQEKGQTVLQYILSYLNSSQGTAQQAVSFLQHNTNPNAAQLLSIQFAMQRASQKVELLASIIGSSVSGIKTLMSTQLG